MQKEFPAPKSVAKYCDGGLLYLVTYNSHLGANIHLCSFSMLQKSSIIERRKMTATAYLQ